MKIERYQASPEGWPGVRWEQSVITGETVLSRRRVWRWRLAWLVGAGVAWWGWATGLGLVMAMIAGAVMWAVILAPEGWRALSLDLGAGGSTRALEPTEDERNALARARVKRGQELQACRAELVVPGVSRIARFCLWRRNGRAEKKVFEIPLEDLGDFQLDTAQAWFGDAASGELRRLGHAPEEWLIVAVTKRYGVLPVARSAGSKAEMAELHLVLTDAFLGAQRSIAGKVDDLRGFLQPGDEIGPPSVEEARKSAAVEAAAIRAAMGGQQSMLDRLSDNLLFGWLLRGAGRLRDVMVSWLLGIVAVVVVLLWLTGGFQKLAVWEMLGLNTGVEKPLDAAGQRAAERQARAKKERELAAVAGGFDGAVKELLKLLNDGFSFASLPQKCVLGAEPVAGRISSFVGRYEAVLQSWEAVPENKAVASVVWRAGTERVLVERMQQAGSGLEHLKWMVGMFGKPVSQYRSSKYYPPGPEAVKKAVETYVTAVCVKNTNLFSKQNN